MHVNGQVRHSLGAAGRELVTSRYAWEVIGEKLERAYQLAVAERATAEVA